MAVLRSGALLLLALWICLALPPLREVLPGTAHAKSAKCTGSWSDRRPRCRKQVSPGSILRAPARHRSSKIIIAGTRRGNLRRASYITQIPNGLRRRDQPDYRTITSSGILRCRLRYGPRRTCLSARPEGNDLVRALIEAPQAGAAAILDEAGIPVVAGVPPIVIVTPQRPPSQAEPISDRVLP